MKMPAMQLYSKGKGTKERERNCLGRKAKTERNVEERKRKREVGLPLLALVSKLPHVAVTSKQQQQQQRATTCTAYANVHIHFACVPSFAFQTHSHLYFKYTQLNTPALVLIL